MNRTKRFSLFMILIMLVLTLTSCGYKDIDKRAFVVTIGVDKAENENKDYKVMLKIAIPPTEAKGAKQEFIVSEQESNSITDAVRMIKSKVDKELDFSHAKAIIYGEDVVNEDIKGVLDWFIRRRDIQKIAWVGIGKPNAEEILKMERKVELLPSNSLFLSFGKTGTESVYIVSEYLFDFRRRLTERGIDPILPVIEAKDQFFQIKNVAVLNTDKLKMTLSAEETKFLNIMLGRVENADIRVKAEANDEKDAYFLSGNAITVKYKVLTNQKDAPIIKVDLHVDGVIEEAMKRISEKHLEKPTKLAEKQLEKKVKQLLEKLQEEQLDPVGFGLKYRATHLNEKDWDEWKEIYAIAEFQVHADISIEGTGLLK
ncbi:Ger(x)C family spore germination protein [Aquibacillus kalidii]|uniref:Ger(x)C family spore germination protein n=1 Tax=Aquibacillus kalidii TaxID=2762597 RepID=UPI00164778CC|nr:Ger(x)C family spore germination protein [Aquibacillus kalidii]